MRNSNTFYLVKMEHGWNSNILGQKIMMLSGLERMFLKVLHAHWEIIKHFFYFIKVSRSRNKIVELKLLLKNKRTNLFFYPDNSEILETWCQTKFKFQVFTSRQDRKTNSFVCFLGGVMAQQLCFEIYWPLEKADESRQKQPSRRKNF